MGSHDSEQIGIKGKNYLFKKPTKRPESDCNKATVVWSLKTADFGTRELKRREARRVELEELWPVSWAWRNKA